MNDDLGDRMKAYEKVETERMFSKGKPIYVRIDGKCFSSYTRGLSRPYDERMSNLMIGLTKELVKVTNAVIGYTQSDEISLILYTDKPETQLYFDGKIQKLNSVLASISSGWFSKEACSVFPDKSYAVFDCRCFQLPDLTEATNALIWRELDARKNSITMAAGHYYSHLQLQGKNGEEKIKMLAEAGINWNDYPSFFKFGTYVQRRKFMKYLTDEELGLIDPKHRPIQPFERSEVVSLDIPPLVSIPLEDRLNLVFSAGNPRK